MNQSFSSFLHNKYTWLVLFLLTYAMSFFFLPEEVPLYYSTLLREDKLATKYELLIIPFFLFLLFILWEKVLMPLSLQNTYVRKLVEGFIVFLSCIAYISFVRIILRVI